MLLLVTNITKGMLPVTMLPVSMLHATMLPINCVSCENVSYGYDYVACDVVTCVV